MAILQKLLLVISILILSIWFNNPVLAALPKNTLDIFNTGIDNLKRHNYQQALINFTQVIDSQDNLVGAAAYSNRCLVDLQLQNNPAAEADCTIAIKYNSDNLEANLNLGLAYYRQEKYQRAIAVDREIIQRNQQEYRAYYNRGLAYSAIDNYQNAIADYQMALIHSPDSDESKSLIYNDLALAHLASTNNEAARSNFSSAIALNNQNYHAYYNRGCLYHRQGKYQAAIDDFSQAIQFKPDFTQAYVHRGILYHQIGEMDTASNDLNLALQQYLHQGDREQYDSIVNLKQQLFHNQPNRIASLEFWYVRAIAILY
jgi:tetratricopeptide (TPR) repeat protein